MAVFRAFEAVRPAEQYASEVAALPYDVMNSEEARKMAEGHPFSFLHIDRAEIDLPEGTDPYSDAVYEKAASNLKKMEHDGILVKDPDRAFYIYREIMGSRSQAGLVGCASIDDYNLNIIKKHELTVAAKEADRIHHVDTTDANTGPIFLTFRGSQTVEHLMKLKMDTTEPIYDFTSEDGVRHTVWKISDKNEVMIFENAFADMNALYIADGHHRAASAVKVGMKRRQQHPDWKGNEEFNYFLAVAFPANELSIWDYNRVVKTAGDLTKEQFLEDLQKDFAVSVIENPGSVDDDFGGARPTKKHDISLYLDHTWYRMTAKPESYDANDPVDSLDVSILQNRVLSEYLDIKDPRTDPKIEFVGGIRGLNELVEKVDKGDFCAFAMYPTSMDDLMTIADAGKIMPPKSTWFEPKLRSGLFIHELG